MLDPQILARYGTVLLDTARPTASNRHSWCFTAPSDVLTAATPDAVPALLDDIESRTQEGKYVAGYLSYEAGYPFVDRIPPSTVREPVAWFGVYDAPVPVAPSEIDLGLAAVEGTSSVRDIAFSMDRPSYTDAIDRVRHHIEQGDVYQINFTAPVHFGFEGDPRVLYRRLRLRQHVPYGAFLNLGDRHLLSCSPELFIRRDGDRVVTRPMKGTIRRGRTLEEDRSLRERLATDPKNRAENLMIVDLLRNDLSVCCEEGSVQVPELYTTEPYDTVTQMTSTVEGRLRDDQGIAAVLRALFPCGSVTGAPKRRAMGLIQDLEPEPRGVYCGAIGMIGPETATFNVAIRTVVLKDGEQGRMGVGSGIVWESEPEAEYEECELKTQFLTPSAASAQIADPDHEHRLIETMRFDGVRLPLLDEHTARLSQSAEYFGYPFDEDRFRERVTGAVVGADPETILKVRAMLDRWGRLTVETSPLQEDDEPWEITIASERIDRTDPFFFHKTTHRHVYDRALAAAQEAGADEALLLNEEEEITEGTYSNVFIREGEHLSTPPVECGLLDGVYRQYVLEAEEQARERVLTLEDVREADAIFCCNALRGWKPAVLREAPVTTS